MRECQLILTVRDAAEVRAIEPLLDDRSVVESVAPWAIDVKDPRSGPLGRPAENDVTAVLQVVRRRWPVSVAWGELSHHASDRLSPPNDWQGQVDLLKLGLAGLAGESDWPDRLAAATGRLRPTAQVVAVIYADGDRCGAPSPADVVQAAADCDCPVILIDTYDKRRGPLTRLWSATRLQRWIDRIQNSGRQVAVAGSLRAEDLPAIHACHPNYVALRSALCHHDRSSGLAVDRVRDICDRWVKLSALDFNSVPVSRRIGTSPRRTNTDGARSNWGNTAPKGTDPDGMRYDRASRQPVELPTDKTRDWNVRGDRS